MIKFIKFFLVITILCISKLVGASVVRENIPSSISAVQGEYIAFSDAEQNNFISDQPIGEFKIENGLVLIGLDCGAINTIGIDSELSGADFDLSISCLLKTKVQGIEIAQFSLSISNDQPQAIYRVDLIPFILADPSIAGQSLVLDCWLESGISLPSILADKAQLSLDLRVDYAVPVQDACLPTLINDVSVTSGRLHTFNWMYSCDNQSGFQLQVKRVYNTVESVDDDLVLCNTEMDWADALSIELPNDALTNNENEYSFSLILAEGTGFYVWRVRALSSYYSGNSANSENWGNWSTDSPEQNDHIELSLSTVQILPEYIYVEDEDEDKNWIYNRVFTEYARIHEQMNYADYLSNNRQMQVVYGDKVVVSQTVLDYTGRPVISTLPAPVQGQRTLTGYIDGVASYTDGGDEKPYLPQQFDTKDAIDDPAGMAGVVSDYYSNNNPDITIPNANNYPFTRVVYDNSGLSRVIEQSAPGDILSIVNGHTVRTAYSVPSDVELIMLFGSQAPDAQKVLKITTIDQNNTSSVSYIGAGGRVIATCVLGGDDSTLETPSSFNTQNQHFVPKDEMMVEEKLISKLQFGLVSETEVFFNSLYNEPEIPDFFSCIQAPQCTYETKYYVKSLDGTDLTDYCPLFDTEDPSLCVIATSSSLSYSLGHVLPAGYYEARRTVRSTGTSGGSAMSAAEVDEKNIKAIVDRLTPALRNIADLDGKSSFITTVCDLNDELQAVNENYAVCVKSSTGSILTRDDAEDEEVLATVIFKTLNIRTCCSPGLGIDIDLENIEAGTQPPSCDGVDFENKFIYQVLVPLYQAYPEEERPDIFKSSESDEIDETKLMDYIYAEKNPHAIENDDDKIVNWYSFFPRYDQGDFNLMINNMLTEEFFYWDDTYDEMLIDTILGDLDHNGTFESAPMPMTHYTCTDITVAFETMLGSYMDIVDQMKQMGNPNVTGSDESEEQPESAEHTDVFNEIPMNFILKWYIKKKWKHSPEDEAKGSDAEFNASGFFTDVPLAPEFFLNSTGRKMSTMVNWDKDLGATCHNSWIFNQIALKNYSVVGSDLPLDYFTSLKRQNRAEMRFDPNLEDDDNAYQYFYNHILNPLYAYRVFEYFEGENQNAQLSSCYDGLTLDELKAGIVEFGDLKDHYGALETMDLDAIKEWLWEDDYCLGVNIHTWELQDINRFYASIAYEPTNELPETTVDDVKRELEEFLPPWSSCKNYYESAKRGDKTNTDYALSDNYFEQLNYKDDRAAVELSGLINKRTALFNGCVKSAEKRYQEFAIELQETFQANGYLINMCNAENQEIVITDMDIEEMFKLNNDAFGIEKTMIEEFCIDGEQTASPSVSGSGDGKEQCPDGEENCFDYCYYSPEPKVFVFYTYAYSDEVPDFLQDLEVCVPDYHKVIIRIPNGTFKFDFGTEAEKIKKNMVQSWDIEFAVPPVDNQNNLTVPIEWDGVTEDDYRFDNLHNLEASHAVTADPNK